MSDEVPPDPPAAETIPAPPLVRRARTSGVRSRLVHWLGELATVFIGVYAAFLLGNHASHRQERQRRAQLLTWVEERYTGVRNNAQEQLPKLRERIEIFNGKLAAGQMPEVKPYGWIGDYDPADSAGVLQSGGYDLLNIETIRDMREVESTLRQLVSVAVHAQQLSDTLILPNRGKDPAVFYDPETRQLRETYAWIPNTNKDLADLYEELEAESTKLLAQVRADREHGR